MDNLSEHYLDILFYVVVFDRFILSSFFAQEIMIKDFDTMKGVYLNFDNNLKVGELNICSGILRILKSDWLTYRSKIGP